MRFSKNDLFSSIEEKDSLGIRDSFFAFERNFQNSTKLFISNLFYEEKDLRDYHTYKTIFKSIIDKENLTDNDFEALKSLSLNYEKAIDALLTNFQNIKANHLEVDLLVELTKHENDILSLNIDKDFNITTYKVDAEEESFKSIEELIRVYDLSNQDKLKQSFYNFKTEFNSEFSFEDCLKTTVIIEEPETIARISKEKFLEIFEDKKLYDKEGEEVSASTAYEVLKAQRNLQEVVFIINQMSNEYFMKNEALEKALESREKQNEQNYEQLLEENSNVQRV